VDGKEALLMLARDLATGKKNRQGQNGPAELGKFQAIQGKTWNHPVVAHGNLFVRNGAQFACYQLAPGGK
jgi:hypothetical protein